MARGLILVVAALCGIVPVTIARQAKDSPQATSADNDEAKARAVCGVCHALPPPDVLPRGAWPGEFVRMMYVRENRLPPVGRGTPQVELPPDLQAALPYYMTRAP